MNNANFLMIVVLVAALAGTGCTGSSSLGAAARSGDTIVVSLGWQQELTRADIEVTITDSEFNSVVYPPGDTAVRALWQSYPDPISNLIVGGETGQDNIEGSLTGIATTLIDGAATGGDKDYSQTFMLIDLPPGMALGPATISFTDSLGAPINKPTVSGGQLNSMNVEIVAIGGSPDSFQTQDGLVVLDGYLKAMERTPHYTVSLQGGSVPYGVHLKFTHDPDMDNGGVGRAYVSHPRPDLKSVTWRDDGYNLDVILLPAQAKLMADIKQFKFYIAGGITGLTLVSTEAYTSDGASINDDAVPENDIVAIVN